MGSISPFTVLLLLLFADGTNAAGRLYPTSQEESNNETSFLAQTPWLQGLAEDTNGSAIAYSAAHMLQDGDYYGFSVTMDVYDFALTSAQYTLAGVRMFNKKHDAATCLNSIQICWEVSPQTYGGDSRAHLSAFWSDGGLQRTCINTDCSGGFQPEAGAPTVLGSVIEPVSQATGVKQRITIKVVKDSASGDWLVHYGFNQPDPVLIGRYPKSIFTGGLADRATDIYIGAVVVSENTDSVSMGSGYLPTDDNMATATAASFSNIQIIDQNGNASLLNHDLPVYMTKLEKYSVSPVINGQFFYGGPNWSTT